MSSLGAGGFDLSALDTSHDGSAVMEVRDPVSDKPLLVPEKGPVTITLLGEDSPRYRAAQHTLTNRRLGRGAFRRVRSEEMEQAQLEIYAACTVAWVNVIVDGAELPCTRENALALYQRFRWLANQIAEFMQDRANFLPSAGTASGVP